MLRAFHISAIILSVIAIAACLFFMDEVSSYRDASLMDYSNDQTFGTDNYDFYRSQAEKDTVAAGASTFFYFMAMETIFILSLFRIRTKTMKVISIIGITFTGIMMLWDGLMISSPNSISFDEVGGAWVFYMITVLAFSIIGTIHAFRRRA